MFKWPGTPSPRAPEHELADFAELVCWRHRSTSTTALSADLGRLEENDYSAGVPEEDELAEVVEGAYLEIERRQAACRGGYPYALGEHGYTLTLAVDDDNHRHVVYQYLLLATRLNMSSNRVHAGIDGTLLLEELAADAAREYLGHRAESLVFGTSAELSDFRGKVDRLCKRLREGGGFLNRDRAEPTQRDGKLDVVVWKPFADGNPGKLIAFGQCKTGTDYRDAVSQLQPDSFCKKWLHSSPVLTPVRMFFAAEALSRLRWHGTASDAGLLFDRCRIVDFCDDLTTDVVAKVKTWTEAAAASTELPV
ncbi:MAG: hypothetical protein OXQ31_08380 [Spirochaetaceae bacterium]|nr:hypothetical protein [Spirochaetaceae bacterium]